MVSTQSSVAFPAAPAFELLTIWCPEATDATLSAVKAAKVSLGTSTLVKLVQAVPGSPGRVLAIGSPPPFACEWLGVKDTTDLQKLAHVVAWVIHEATDDRSRDELDFLKGIFGNETREITNE